MRIKCNYTLVSYIHPEPQTKRLSRTNGSLWRDEVGSHLPTWWPIKVKDCPASCHSDSGTVLYAVPGCPSRYVTFLLGPGCCCSSVAKAESLQHRRMSRVKQKVYGHILVPRGWKGHITKGRKGPWCMESLRPLKQTPLITVTKQLLP